MIRSHGSKDIERAFFRYRTQKEAVIKAHGKGLSVPLKTFEVEMQKTWKNTWFYGAVTMVQVLTVLS